MKEAYIRTNDKAEHDGEVSVLDTSYDADRKTLTFQTNLFSSDYAITYKDTKVKETKIRRRTIQARKIRRKMTTMEAIPETTEITVRVETAQAEVVQARAAHPQPLQRQEIPQM